MGIEMHRTKIFHCQQLCHRLKTFDRSFQCWTDNLGIGFVNCATVYSKTDKDQRPIAIVPLLKWVGHIYNGTHPHG
jgi:hypothetical protein